MEKVKNGKNKFHCVISYTEFNVHIINPWRVRRMRHVHHGELDPTWKHVGRIKVEASAVKKMKGNQKQKKKVTIVKTAAGSMGQYGWPS